jgi:hypothetical protein
MKDGKQTMGLLSENLGGFSHLVFILILIWFFCLMCNVYLFLEEYFIHFEVETLDEVYKLM